MRQVKNCKVGHFVKYNGVLCQVNCFYTNFRGKQATLVEVKEGSRRFYPVDATEKVEYIGDHARDEHGNFWVCRRTEQDAFESRPR